MHNHHVTIWELTDEVRIGRLQNMFCRTVLTIWCRFYRLAPLWWCTRPFFTSDIDFFWLTTVLWFVRLFRHGLLWCLDVVPLADSERDLIWVMRRHVEHYSSAVLHFQRGLSEMLPTKAGLLGEVHTRRESIWKGIRILNPRWVFIFPDQRPNPI